MLGALPQVEVLQPGFKDTVGGVYLVLLTGQGVQLILHIVRSHHGEEVSLTLMSQRLSSSEMSLDGIICDEEMKKTTYTNNCLPPPPHEAHARERACESVLCAHGGLYGLS